MGAGLGRKRLEWGGCQIPEFYDPMLIFVVAKNKANKNKLAIRSSLVGRKPGFY